MAKAVNHGPCRRVATSDTPRWISGVTSRQAGRPEERPSQAGGLPTDLALLALLENARSRGLTRL
jgi:hypothetical protein